MDPEVITRLGFLFGPLVAFFGIGAIWFYSLYNLDRAKHAAILAELKVRRANTSADSPANVLAKVTEQS
jgi:Na+/melibiose symporter-like transporter